MKEGLVDDLSIKGDSGDWFFNFASNGFGGGWDGQPFVTGAYSPYGAPGDFDGDGSLNLGWLYEGSPPVWAYEEGGGFTSQIFNLGTEPAEPVPGDYDGDGRTDLAVITETGIWGVRYANQGFLDEYYYTPSTAQYPAVGLLGADPVPGDYDGDGKWDLSVRRVDGAWLIDYASNNFGAWDAVFTGRGNASYVGLAREQDEVAAASDEPGMRVFDGSPVRGTARIRFSVAATEDVRVRVFDVRGRQVCAPIEARVESGSTELTWRPLDQNGARLRPGVYWLEGTFGTQRAVSRVLIVD